MTFEEWDVTVEANDAYYRAYSELSWRTYAHAAFEAGRKAAAEDCLYTLETAEGDLDFFVFLVKVQFDL